MTSILLEGKICLDLWGALQVKRKKEEPGESDEKPDLFPFGKTE